MDPLDEEKEKNKHRLLLERLRAPISSKDDDSKNLHRTQGAYLQIIHLLLTKQITQEQYNSLYNMIGSPDKENLVVAEEIIKKKLE